jgi:steroid delta-isomerase-like uncharacterized protein
MTGSESRPAPVDEARLNDLLARAVAAFNAHDADALVAMMTDDVVVEHSAAPAALHGRTEVSAFYTARLWKAFPDLRLELADGPFFHPHAPRVSIRWLAVGTHTGPLDPPGLAPTGKRVQVDAREIAEFRNGLFSRIQVVADMADAMRQLGALPAPGSRAERAMAMMQRLQTKLPRHR